MARRKRTTAVQLSRAEIPKMRKACELAAETLLHVAEHLRVGMTTDEIDALVEDFAQKHGARSGPLGYKGFPKSCCTSLNEVVCHGIPGPQVIRDGDILNVDVTPVLPATNGFFGDTSATFYIGEPSPLAKHLVEVTRQCLEIGIAQVKPGGRIGDIGEAIHAFAESKGCSVVSELTGHGIGRVFHGPPTVSHQRPNRHTPEMVPGMTFTIEPMINIGSAAVEVLDDDWTVVTLDRSLSAQFEHTVLVTSKGCEVLTRRDRVLRHSEDVAWAVLGPLASHVPDPVAAR